ncbi:MAG: PiT family inorganic phosphate transporter [Akkermansiaceae bacterium]|jgi:PiT family inorganic phosphate transporter
MLIAASWVISPVIGGIIAAGFLYWIKRSITYKKDMISAAQRILPILVSIMVLAVSTYLIMKGLKKVVKVDLLTAVGIGMVLAVLTYFIVRSLTRKHSVAMENGKKSINRLFTFPLIFAAALLSFAHGANDVANAVGPLAAIADTIDSQGVASKAPIPFWVMAVGASGIVLGLALFGPKLIRTVGSEITELDQMRAFCIAMADKRKMLAEIKEHTTKAELTKRERKELKKVYRQELVKRSALIKIAAAWIITVPASGIMAALLFYAIRAMMLP